ncbi:MAG: hypothetical protein AAGI91_04390, partial [Bacteroidota bacterium]
MDQPFVDGVRALSRPVTLPTKQDEGGGLVAGDAAQYLREQIVGRGRLGLLLQGRPLLGKTRFLTEWLRQEHPAMFVLAPDPGKPTPPLPDRLAQHLSHGCCLFLDDLEQFDECMKSNVMPLLGQLSEQAEQRSVPFLVLATVRDGGPGSTVLNDPSFRSLREGLEHVEIQPPTDALIDEVAKQVEPDPLPPGEREQSFAFVLEGDFEVQRTRYQDLLRSEKANDRQALRWLKTAKLLDDRGISLTRARLQRIAEALFDFEPEQTEEALSVLQEQGFRDRQALEPAFLKNVVPGPQETQADLPEHLEETLQAQQDAEALFEWGTLLAIEGRESERAARLLRASAKAGRDAATPEGLVQVAKASYNLGWLLSNRMDDPDGARTAWEAAVAAGREASTAEGLVEVAKASVNLGWLLSERMDDPDGARTAYEAAVAVGREASTAEGLVQVAMASYNLGWLLSNRMDDPDGARTAYEAAVA